MWNFCSLDLSMTTSLQSTTISALSLWSCCFWDVQSWMLSLDINDSKFFFFSSLNWSTKLWFRIRSSLAHFRRLFEWLDQIFAWSLLLFWPIMGLSIMFVLYLFELHFIFLLNFLIVKKIKLRINMFNRSITVIFIKI